MRKRPSRDAATVWAHPRADDILAAFNRHRATIGLPSLAKTSAGATEVVRVRIAELERDLRRPILVNRGPVPLRRDLANHDGETARSLATWAGCNRGGLSHRECIVATRSRH
jgi:hypothetical protein